MNASAIGIAAALGSAASWALGAIAFKKLGDDIPPLAMTFAKSLLSTVLLGIFVALSGSHLPPGRDALVLAASGILGIAIGDYLFFKGLRDLSAHVIVALFMFSQALTAVLALLVLGERPPAIAWLGILLILCGVGFVLWLQVSGEEGSFSWRGVMYCGLSTLFSAISVIIAKFVLHSVSALDATFIRMAAGLVALGLLGGAMRQLGGWLHPFRDRALLGRFTLAVSIITFGGFWLSMLAVKLLDVAIANALIGTEPIWVLPFAAIFLKEKVTPGAVIGTLASACGVALLCRFH